MMKRNILIVSAGKRVALVQAFKETLARFFPEAKVYTADMNPEMAPACYVSDGCFKVPKVSDEQYAEHLLAICEENGVGMVIRIGGAQCLEGGMGKERDIPHH